MYAAEVMDPNPTTLKATDTIECAANYIMDKRYRNMPVIDENHRYVGMFGVNCLLRQMIPRSVLTHKGLENVGFIHETLDDLYRRFDEVKHQPISVCMGPDIQPVNPDTPLVETMLQLYETRSSIPVVDKNNRLLGMISYWDIGEKVLAAEAHRNA